MDDSDNQKPISQIPELPEDKKVSPPENYPHPENSKLSSSQKVSVIALMVPLLALPVALMLTLAPVQLFNKAAENTPIPTFAVTPTPIFNNCIPDGNSCSNIDSVQKSCCSNYCDEIEKICKPKPITSPIEKTLPTP